MWQEQNHQRPHFHIEYKQEYSASYSVDTMERLAGEMPNRYEGPYLGMGFCQSTVFDC
jgi:hypothetical protein